MHKTTISCIPNPIYEHSSQPNFPLTKVCIEVKLPKFEKLAFNVMNIPVSACGGN